MLARTSVPLGSYNVQFALARVLTPSLLHGTLAIFDARGEHLDTVQVASSCHDACALV
jgi:hypothetical protein